MRWLIAFLIACKGERAEPSPQQTPPPATPPVAVAPSKAPVASLTVAATTSLRIVVPPKGAVTIDGRSVELADVAPLVPKTSDPWMPPAVTPASGSGGGTSYGVNPGGPSHGMVWLRVPAIVGRPLIVIDGDVPAIRMFEVAAAAQPMGAAVEVLDHGSARAFAFRAADPNDRQPADINDPIEMTITPDEIRIAGPTEPSRELPISATVAELSAAVAAVAPTQLARLPWGFITLRDPKHTTAIAIAATEALAAAGVAGVSFIAGRPGMPTFKIEAPNPIARRWVKRNLKATVACYATWLADHPGHDGRVELAFVVAGGVAKTPKVTQTGLDDSVATCIATVFATVEIPNQKQPLVIPIAFEPDGG